MVKMMIVITMMTMIMPETKINIDKNDIMSKFMMMQTIKTT